MISQMRLKRILAQLSIYDLAIKTGIDPSKISLIERDYKIPRPDEQEKIAKALQCSLEEVFPSRSEVNGI